MIKSQAEKILSLRTTHLTKKSISRQRFLNVYPFKRYYPFGSMPMRRKRLQKMRWTIYPIMLIPQGKSYIRKKECRLRS